MIRFPYHKDEPRIINTRFMIAPIEKAGIPAKRTVEGTFIDSNIEKAGIPDKRNVDYADLVPSEIEKAGNS